MSDNTEPVPVSRQALADALVLSAQLLEDFELGRAALGDLALRTMRLARLVNDFDMAQTVEYEIGGYPNPPGGISPQVWKLAIAAGRTYETVDPGTKAAKQFAYVESIPKLEQVIKAGEIAIAAARDANVSVSSANPNQFVAAPTGNTVERQVLRTEVAQASQRLSSRKAFLYSYVLRQHYELKYSGIADDAFTRVRAAVDQTIGAVIPKAVQQFTAVYDNLRSVNPEDWANAAHSCRRVLQALADAVQPPGPDRVIPANGRVAERTILMGPDAYINRLVAYAESKTGSERFAAIVGSELRYLGDRLDALFSAAQKGSHSHVTREEADRLVVYTYLLVGDILSL